MRRESHSLEINGSEVKMNLRSLRTFVGLIVVSAVLLPFSLSAQKSLHWGYEGREGPANWSKLDPAYATCAIGRRQSPIDIRAAKSSALPALRFEYKAVPLNVIDNGHTIQVNYAPGSVLSVGDKTYVLKQFHFHHPSEEYINGYGYDMVAHLVHEDAAGNLAVVAVLFKTGQANALIDQIWKNIPREKNKAVDVFGTTINARNLLPSDLGYFTFSGSLTTPPCSEGVTWFVLKSATSLSPSQLAVFANLYPNNARPIQPTNGRKILETK
jgi:carbonic anhydrase